MANVYNTIYKGDFCDKQGNDIFIEFKQRMDSSLPVPAIIPIQFAGENDAPVVVTYANKGEYKLEGVNGSSCDVNIKAIGTFELSSLYTADEREWMVVLSGGWVWQGWLIPDACSEPYKSKPYDVSISATDALGTLKDIPFLQADGTKYKGFISDLEVLRQALLKTGLSLPFIVGVNTFEAQMVTTDSPLRQSFINCDRFIDNDGNAFSCHEVIRSVLARYSSRIHQFNGYWQIINVLELSTGVVPAFEYDQGAILVGTTTIGSALTVGGTNRVLSPVGNNSFAKAFSSSTAYYQYGYGANALDNANMDVWTTNPVGLPDNWSVQNGATAHTATRLDQNGNPTNDHYVIIDSSGASGYLYNSAPVLVRAQETTTVSFDVLVPSAPGGAALVFLYLGVLITDGAGNYFTNNNGWQPGFQFYVIRYRSGDFGPNQVGVNFKVNARNSDYDLYFGVQSLQEAGPADYPTSINNVNIVPAVNSDQTKPPVGLFNRQKSLAAQTFSPDPILLLHGDDTNDKRTSQISIGAVPPFTASFSWARAGITETSSLLEIVANTELRLHGKPYRIFEADFIGFGSVDINTLLTIDLLPGNYIFLSGSFDLKRSIPTLRFAETLTADISHTTEVKEDYGTEKDKTGLSVGVPSGVNAPGSGSSAITLGNYPQKDEDATISGDWNFTGTLKQNGSNVLTQANLSALENSLNKSANYTVLPANFGSNGMVTVYVDASAGAVNITLPSVANLMNRTVEVIKIDSTSNPVNVIGTINGSPDDLLPLTYSSARYKSNGVDIYKMIP